MLAAASSQPIGIPSPEQIKYSRKPQNQREWLRQ
jgi:hypothetical protein